MDKIYRIQIRMWETRSPRLVQSRRAWDRISTGDRSWAWLHFFMLCVRSLVICTRGLDESHGGDARSGHLVSTDRGVRNG
jgi:hypothetical protein